MGLESYMNGKTGEDIASEYLKQQGFSIIERNFHSQQGEIDIIAQDKDCLVFAEVKNYSFKSYGSPVGAVRKSKKQSIIHAAQTYLYKKNIRNIYARFDVVTIYRKKDGSNVIEHYKNAFMAS